MTSSRLLEDARMEVQQARNELNTNRQNEATLNAQLAAALEAAAKASKDAEAAQKARFEAEVRAAAALKTHASSPLQTTVRTRREVNSTASNNGRAAASGAGSSLRIPSVSLVPKENVQQDDGGWWC